MAFLQCTLKSQALELETAVNLILPGDQPKWSAGARPVLYLLHGRGQNAHAWSRYTSLERYVEQYGLCVVMPEVQRSFYTDMAYGGAYFTYISEELPRLCETMFRLENDPASTYVAGLSMGGYGALKLALAFPERFAGCAAFSSVADIRYRIANPGSEKRRLELIGVFGSDLQPRGQDDLFALADRAAGAPHRPSMLLTCGTGAALYPLNTAFSAHLSNVGIAHSFQEWPGAHDWTFWDESLRRALAFFFPSETLG
jgi:S-formylglutathione hydrolase FrmB